MKPYYETKNGVLYHGDCLDVIPELKQSVDFVLTDPPYNINLKPQRKKTESISNDNMSNNEFEIFIESYFNGCKKILKNDKFLVCFMGWPTIPEFYKGAKKHFTLKSMPVWIKNNFGIGYYTRPQYEPAMLLLNGDPKKLEKPISDVWDFRKVHVPCHSCEKPVPLLMFILENFSNEGDIVFDGFGGSGTTAIACEEINRKWILIEKEEEHCELSAKRIEQSISQLTLPGF